jgi:hypothetical protein
VIHLGNYLSHALALPLLFLLPACLQSELQRPRPGGLARLMLLFAVVSTIYPEFLPIFLGLVALHLGAAVAIALVRWRQAVPWFLLVAVSPLVLAPLALSGLIQPLQRTGEIIPTSERLAAVLPFLPVTIWHGDATVCLLPLRITLRLAQLLLVLGLVGLVLAVWRGYRNRELRPTVLLPVVLLALAPLPVVAWLAKAGCSYQVHKLALTVAPVAVLGLALLAQIVLDCRLEPLGRTAVGICASVLVLVPAWGTFLLKRETVKNEVVAATFAPVCQDDQACTGRRWLAGSPPSAWILSGGCRRTDAWRTAWLCWYGRKHRLWVLPARLHEQPLHLDGVERYGDLESAPPEANYLTGGRSGFEVLSPGAARRSGCQDGLTWWVLLDGRWAVPVSVSDDQGALAERPTPLLAGRPWRMELVARCAGEVEIRAHWGGPTAGRACLTVTGSGAPIRRLVTPGDILVRLAVPAGRHHIGFSLEPETPGGSLTGAFPLGSASFAFVPAPARDLR